MHQNKVLHRQIWQLAWPMIISNISVPLLGIVDTAILGHLQQATHLGAVALGSSVLAFVYWGFGFLRMGTTGLVAQATGSEQTQSSTDILQKSMLLALLAALVVLLFHSFIFQFTLQLMAVENELRNLAYNYCAIRIYSAPAVLLSYVLIGWFIGQQNTRIPLLIVLITNFLNILLDCILILGLGMKSEGAALATLLSEYAGFLVALWVLHKHYNFFASLKNYYHLCEFERYLKLLAINRHLFVRTICLLFCLAFFTAQGAQQGENILAANSILMQLIMLSAFGLDAFAHAVEAICGKAIGAKNLPLFFRIIRASILWSLSTALLFTLFFIVFKVQLITLFTDISAVRLYIDEYYGWLILLPLVTVWSYLFDGIFVGATQSQGMQNSMLLSCFAVYLPAWFFLQDFGNHGLWAAFLLFSLARSLIQFVQFQLYTKQNRWLL
jgi:MATE family multidrug resistance protein